MATKRWWILSFISLFAYLLLFIAGVVAAERLRSGFTLDLLTLNVLWTGPSVIGIFVGVSIWKSLAPMSNWEEVRLLRIPISAGGAYFTFEATIYCLWNLTYHLGPGPPPFFWILTAGETLTLAIGVLGLSLSVFLFFRARCRDESIE